MEDIETIKQKSHNVVIDILPNITEQELVDNTNLFNLGLDSVNAIMLVMSLEETFGLKLEQSDISLENFSTIESIVNMIKRKKGV